MDSGCNKRIFGKLLDVNKLNITVSQAYAPTSNAEEAEVEWFHEDLQDF